MTRTEIKLVLKQMDDRGAYGLRVFLDNRTTVLAHEWYLEGTERSGEGGNLGEGQVDSEKEGLLRVVTRGRQALIAISRIVLIEMVPPPPPV
jgi:hypothetical protein